MDGKDRFVLRLYNNSNNAARVKFEHAVLRWLVDNVKTLSFALPVTLPALNGEAYITTASGAEAALFRLIPGRLPKLSCTRAIGRASGELTLAMEKVAVPLASPTAPYWDIYAVHRSVTRDNFHAMAASSAFDEVRAATSFLLDALHRTESSIDAFKALGLPEQLIHGDLHYDNTLVDGDGEDGRVTGLLDFEFCATDFRAMELAICLSKYISADDPLPYLTDFILGFKEKMRLTEAECRAIPGLISLRVVSNVVYFVGRAIGGEDDISSLTTRAEEYARRIRWLDANGDKLIALLLAP